jgi:hypothetical protein
MKIKQCYTDSSWSHRPVGKSDTRSQDQYPNTHIHDPLSLSSSTGLTLLHVYALRCNVFVYFVDIGEIVDHHH